ncbi:hypothetical protein ANCDUO_04756 [Ancylostoma duodenale]|uniref:Uncharacterized protein n=1 Tax=Ancylostoma duodenale TaxID=51022 RepID=A0A0C2H688_9BILA|nr:hypothetical protein ANCDUO_04756 [Ancylostoma duodenale]
MRTLAHPTLRTGVRWWSALSVSQSCIESLLESSASIYDTANGGVQVLSDTVSHAEGELENFYTRVEELRRGREQALEAATESVTQRKVKLEEIYQKCLHSKDHQSGLEKLSALLSRLKIDEDTNFTAVENGFGGTAQHIEYKTCSGNTLRQTVNELESKCTKVENFDSEMGSNVQFQNNDILSKLAMLEGVQVSDCEKLHILHCRQEELNGQFKDDFEKKDWDEQKWQKILEEQSEEEALLDPRIMKMNEDISAMKDSLAQPTEDGNVAEAILTLERDLLSYMGVYNEERKRIQEQRTEILSRLNTAQSKIAALKAADVEKENEHQKLISDVKSLQAQIDAFTNLRTPAKEVVTPGAKSRKTTTGRRASRRAEEVDSDDGSSPSGVPFVEGLQPFSPATISLKEQARVNSKKTKKCQQIEEPMDVSRPPANSSAPEAPIISSKSAEKLVSTVEVQENEQVEQNTSVIESLFDLSGSDKSSPHETLVAKRFPNDIFLKKSPSLGQNESPRSSPDVSTMGSTDFDTDREDADQSVWSVVATKPANCTRLDTTAETDLDQSVW